jgi:hypothetical protein
MECDKGFIIEVLIFILKALYRVIEIILSIEVFPEHVGPTIAIPLNFLK